MSNIVFLGPPGCGKGTQGDFLVYNANYFKVSLGDVLRNYRQDSTKLHHKEINELMDTGKLLPDSIVNSVAEDYVLDHKNEQNFLMDGYPRSLNQAEYLDKIFAKINQNINFAIFFDISLDTLVGRLQNRFMCKKCGAIYNKITQKPKIEGKCDICNSEDFTFRKDDEAIDVIKTRFEEYNLITKPVLDYYKIENKLETIIMDDMNPKEIHTLVMKLLNK